MKPFTGLVLIGLVIIGISIAGCTSSTTVNSTVDSAVTAITTAAPTAVAVAPIQVVIDYPFPWQGSIANGGNIKSVQGSGTTSFEISDPSYPISVNVQKKDDSGQMMSVRILKNGKVIVTESTTAAYGIAMATATA